jgi:hypothetical protein
MNCREFQEHLQLLLDGKPAIPDGPALYDHARECCRCRQLYDAAQRLGEGLRTAMVEPPPGHLPERVVGAVLRQRHRAARRRAFLVAGAVAASLAAAWLVPELMHPSPARRQVVRVSQPPGQSIPVPSFHEHFQEARSATLGLTRQVAEETAVQASILIPPADLLPARSLPPPIEAPAMSMRDVGRTVAGGLEPVTSSARRAWDMFLEDLPPRAEEKSGL